MGVTGQKISGMPQYSANQLAERQASIKLPVIGHNDSAQLDNYVVSLSDLLNIIKAYEGKVSWSVASSESSLQDDDLIADGATVELLLVVTNKTIIEEGEDFTYDDVTGTLDFTTGSAAIGAVVTGKTYVIYRKI